MRLLMSADEIRQRPDEWSALRDELVGASDIGSILGLDDAYSSPFGLYLHKIQHSGRPDAIAMRVGRHFESLVLELFAEANPDLAVTPGGLYVSTAPGRQWQAATFDALAYGDSTAPIPVQAKTCYSFKALDEHGRPVWGDPPDGQIPGPYHAQCMQEIDVAGADVAYLPVLPTGTRGEPRVYRIWRDDDDIEAIRQAGQQFADWLYEDTPPPVDWRPETTRALKQMYAQIEHIDVTVPKRLARRVRAARAALKLAERRFGLAENELRALMGPATRALTRDGDILATRSVYAQHRVRVPDLRSKHPRIAQRFGYDVTIDRLNVKQPKIGD